MSMILNLYRLSSSEAEQVVADPMKLYEDYEAVHGSDRFIDLDKAWHALHFLFTGTAWDGEVPACYLLSGAESFGEGVFDYQGQLLRPEDVGAFHAYLESTSEDLLRSRFDPNRMTDLAIYPDIWDRDPAEDDTLGYVLEYHRSLRQFIATAAEAGDSVLEWLA